MQRIEYLRYGGPEEMHLSTFHPRAPAAREVRVRVVASSVNPSDWMLRRGAMKFFTGRRFPRAMGRDFSGIVEDVGRSITRLRAGDEVFGTVAAKRSGAFAEVLIARESMVVKKPATLTHEQAAALPLASVTAWRGLVQKGRLRSGQTLLVNGAYGAVGQAAVRIAHSLGARVTARVGPAALRGAAMLGVECVLDYTEPLPATLRGQFDVVFDCHGSLSAREGELLIKPNGCVLDIAASRAKILRSLYSRRHKFVFGGQNIELLQKVADLAARGALSISIGRVEHLKNAIGLIADLEAGRRCKGKAIIVMP